MLNSVVNYIRCFYEIADRGAIINHILHRLPGISWLKVWVKFQQITNARVTLSPSIYCTLISRGSNYIILVISQRVNYVRYPKWLAGVVGGYRRK